jgi:hypothetical protein
LPFSLTNTAPRSWFTMQWKGCGIVYGKKRRETLVQSVISLTLRLGKLGLQRLHF